MKKIEYIKKATKHFQSRIEAKLSKSSSREIALVKLNTILNSENEEEIEEAHSWIGYKLYSYNNGYYELLAKMFDSKATTWNNPNKITGEIELTEKQAKLLK